MGIMSNKRRNTSSPESDAYPSPKRIQYSGDARSDDADEDEYGAGSDQSYPEIADEKPQVNHYTGQTGAFPGLGADDGDDELFYGPASDGLEYLRMVRSEAKGVPQLLVAEKATVRHDEKHQQQDFGGYFKDGAYAAAPVEQSTPTSTSMPLAQQRYYEDMLRRFTATRLVLQSTPPLYRVTSLDASRIISFPPESKLARKAWEAHILSEYPHPVQIASIDSDDIMQLISFFGRKFVMLLSQVQNLAQTNQLGAWAWAVLGRFPDRGLLGAEEISELRTFAHKAAEALQKLSSIRSLLSTKDSSEALSDGMSQDATTADPPERMDRAELVKDTIEVDEEHNVVQDTVRQLEKMQRVTLEMVVTIVGEAYGQRDLLEYRDNWSSDGG